MQVGTPQGMAEKCVIDAFSANESVGVVPLGTPARCESCGGEFQKTRRWQKFCGRSCRQLAWQERHFARKPKAPAKPSVRRPRATHAQVAQVFLLGGLALGLTFAGINIPISEI